MKLTRWILVLLGASLRLQAAVPAQEGLILHLEATNQAALRRAAELPPLGNGSPVDRWLDARGGPLQATQPWAPGRPVLRADDAEAFLHFDGKDDFLSIQGPKRRLKEATVFLLAAPRSNPGGFSGFFAAAAAGQNDYTSGFNLDQGPSSTPTLQVLSVEVAGSGGFQNMLPASRAPASDLPFGGFHVLCARTHLGDRGTELFLDGNALGARSRAASLMGFDDMVVGGRIYSNEANEPPHAQGSFHGDIAAVLVYDRAVSDVDKENIERALLSRAAGLNALASGRNGHALETVKDPPIVQMLVPGFSVEELPVKLRNQTNLRYRHDGKLVALGYDGRIHLVTDTDGDGREDRASVFWDKSSLRGPIGMALLPKNDPRGDGVLVASKGKVSLILDRDRDGVADEEIIVATGWKEIVQNVDAIGLAVDPRDGSIYFGLGTANYANGYLIDAATGKAHYDLASDRGTIQRVSADFSRRETICTGIRFTCALAFNREGDLFGTEQEGATWLPNGNPLDELLHIQPGLHYGFPPRHPKHLPQVIDEPAVFEYAPQHQSTVGMVFNESVNGGPTFGPASWAGDALVCGESRGKLYRTRLFKTQEGYVAQNQIVACMGMLLVDACVTPKGDLLLACHSGPPDWGTGPAGEGKVFRIRYARPDVPQPAAAWASASDEFRIAFDRPLKDAEWASAREKTRIEAGRYVNAGDRFEVIRPGYQVVRDQMAAPRRWVDVQTLSITADRRTLVLHLPRQTEPVPYSITLPAPASWSTSSPIGQRPEMDLVVSLNGVQATVESGAETARVVLPHPSPAVSRRFTAGSADHEAFFKLLDASESVKSLRLRGGVKVANIFVPAVQPGASLDWDQGADAFANRLMTLRQSLSATQPAELGATTDPETSVASLDLEARGPVRTAGSGLHFALDAKTRPIALNRVLLPWANSKPEKGRTSMDAPIARADVKGRWLRGRRVYFGEGGCVTCHMIRGEGTVFGPDLSNLVYRDRESVLLDITKPSATINPDQTGSLVKFKGGAEASGIIRTLNDQKIVLALPANASMERPRGEVLSIEPMKTSLMPEGLGQLLTAEQMEDLLTFLLTTPIEPARITRVYPSAPPARKRQEFEAFLPSPGSAPVDPPPMRILLCIDDQDHGLDEHDYPAWQKRWSVLLPLADNVFVSQAQGFPSRNQLATADIVVFFSRNSRWSPEVAAQIDAFQARGGGLVYLHWAMEGRQQADALAERIGLATGGSKYRHGALDLRFTTTDHPITRGFTKLSLLDETYWAFHGDEKRIQVLADAVEEGDARTQIWAYERGKARVFGSIPGHYTWTFDDPLYRVLVLRGIAWVGHQKDVNRLLDLVPVGARISP
ncbi:MAG: ThuA domain-containing protein [Verrucomicrobia bacterium]|nr:ThuA domain-containing protein [Verrucomicrobiota bacterium]